MGSDRLRKAIERNRLKQAKRAGRSTQGAGATKADSKSSHSQGDFFSSSTQSTQKRSWSPPGARTRTRPTGTSSIRRGVARPDEETEFSTDIKSRRGATKRATKADYLPATTKPRRKRAARKVATRKRSDRDFIRYLVIGAWIFCGLLLVRLIFSGGGVVDYYSSKSLLDSRHNEHQRIIAENHELREEIRLIESSTSYQRQLVRDHLGYIASDEFLVIFPNSSSGPSI